MVRPSQPWLNLLLPLSDVLLLILYPFSDSYQLLIFGWVTHSSIFFFYFMRIWDCSYVIFGISSARVIHSSILLLRHAGLAFMSLPSQLAVGSPLDLLLVLYLHLGLALLPLSPHLSEVGLP